MNNDQTITYKESWLSDYQIRQTTSMVRSWIAENYWDYDEEVFTKFLPRLDEDPGLRIQLAQTIEEYFALTCHTREDFTDSMARGIEDCLSCAF